MYSVKSTIVIFDNSKLIVAVYNRQHVISESIVYVEIKELAATKTLKFAKVAKPPLKTIEKLHNSEIQKVTLEFEESEASDGKF